MNTASALQLSTQQPTSIHRMAVQVGLDQIKAIYAQMQQIDTLEMELDFDEVQSVFEFELLALDPTSNAWVTEYTSPTICLDDQEAITQLQDVISAANALINPNVLNFPKLSITADRCGIELRTSEEHMFDLLNPQAQAFDITDIAHHLSNICRFNGATTSHYSVAQHSVLVSRIVPPYLALAGLMHDAAEAYVGDLPSPLKALLPDYQDIENNILQTIFEKVGINFPYHNEVKRADLVALATEARDLLKPIGEEKQWESLSGISPCDIAITPMTQQEAEAAFLARYFELQAQAVNLG